MNKVDQKLEDAARKFYPNNDQEDLRIGFVQGAQWQKEQDDAEMYRLKQIASTLNMRLTGKFEVPQELDSSIGQIVADYLNRHRGSHISNQLVELVNAGIQLGRDSVAKEFKEDCKRCEEEH